MNMKVSGGAMFRSDEYYNHYGKAIEIFGESIAATCKQCEEPKINQDRINLSRPLECSCTCERVAKLLAVTRAMRQDLNP